MDVPVKQFVIKHIFKNIRSMKKNERHYSEQEEHFGIPWRMYIYQKNENLSFFLSCLKSLESDEWSADTEFELKVVSPNEKCIVFPMERIFGNINGNTKNAKGIQSTRWKDFIYKDSLSVQAHIFIKRTTGIHKSNFKSFNEEVKEYSDVVLIVGNQKFYVSKLYLAFHSSYFKSLLMGNFEESKKTEIQLSGIDLDDFQKFLEVLYGYSAIDEVIVEGILLLADMYDTQLVIQKCEEFLMEKSKKTLKKKLEMSTRYQLKNLKIKMLSEMKTV